jgi:serine/threonine protein kinase
LKKIGLVSQILDSDQMREAKIYSELEENENIIKFEDCFFDKSNNFYLVLEFCEVLYHTIKNKIFF